MILVVTEKPSVAQSIAKVLDTDSRKDGRLISQSNPSQADRRYFCRNKG